MAENEATPEFTIEAMGPNNIVVRDMETKHRFTFDVAETSDTKGRILSSSAQVRVNPTASLDECAIAGRVRNFAQFEMMKAGHIDRTTP